MATIEPYSNTIGLPCRTGMPNLASCCRRSSKHCRSGLGSEELRFLSLRALGGFGVGVWGGGGLVLGFSVTGDYVWASGLGFRRLGLRLQGCLC